jgi:hypothetical protein
MASLSLAQAASAVRNALAPRARCRTCRATFAKTVFDLPEADGSFVCAACERADLAWHREMNLAPWWDTDDRYADVPVAMLEAAR